jgi:hypothetical protein
MREIRVADETWIATALLQVEQPTRQTFSVGEIVERAFREGLCVPLRPGVQIHASQHCVANKAPNPATYRMLYEPERGQRRLFRHGDATHPHRGGKVTPARWDIPEEYGYLLDWYRDTFDCAAGKVGSTERTSGVDGEDASRGGNGMTEGMSQTAIIKEELTARFRRGTSSGARFEEVVALSLHNAVSHHWNKANRMPNVCRVMREAMRTGDTVEFETDSGQSSTLRIRYRLPRG